MQSIYNISQPVTYGSIMSFVFHHMLESVVSEMVYSGNQHHIINSCSLSNKVKSYISLLVKCNKLAPAEHLLHKEMLTAKVTFQSGE